ncbi:unnamed protein product [Ixodes hexagonus]
MNAAVVLLLCAAALLSSHQGASARSGVEKRTRYCGPDLVSVLNFLCDEYYDPTQKRHAGYHPSHDVPATLPIWFPVLDTSGDSKLGFMEAKEAMQLLRPSAHYGRQTRGIIEECCHKSCTTRELLSYCKSARDNGALPASDDDDRA